MTGVQTCALPILPFPETNNNDFVYQPSRQELEIEFAENFINLEGKFSYCSSYQEFVDQLTQLLEAKKWTKIICKENKIIEQLQSSNFLKLDHETTVEFCDASITSCECLVARTGSILLSNETESGRTQSVYAPIHICIAFASQLVYDISDSLKLLNEKYKTNLPSVISLATGPSRTADIEKTLVVGVHGPKEVFCFLIQD